MWIKTEDGHLNSDHILRLDIEPDFRTKECRIVAHVRSMRFTVTRCPTTERAEVQLASLLAQLNTHDRSD